MNILSTLTQKPWVIAVTASAVCAVAGFTAGWRINADRNAVTIAQLQEQNAETAARALDQARTNEQKLQAEADALTTTYQKEQKNAQNTIEKLRADLRAGTLRLSVPDTDHTSHTGTISPDTRAQHPESRTRLDPAVADTLVSITADGDNAIRNLNRCIDQYNAIRKAWTEK